MHPGEGHLLVVQYLGTATLVPSLPLLPQSGPDFPLIDTCLPATTGCAQFRAEDCDYEGPTNAEVRPPPCLTRPQHDRMESPATCQQFMNQLGPEWGGGVAFSFVLEPKGGPVEGDLRRGVQDAGLQGEDLLGGGRTQLPRL